MKININKRGKLYFINMKFNLIKIYLLKKAETPLTKALTTANDRLVAGYAPINAGGTATATF